MTVSRRILVPVAEVAAEEARGYREVFRMPGGLRAVGEVAVMEWRAPPLLSDCTVSACDLNPSCIVIGTTPTTRRSP